MTVKIVRLQKIPNKCSSFELSTYENNCYIQNCVSVCVCVCVCLCVCVRVYVVYEDTNLYNNMGMTEVLQFEGVL